jgi:3-oxoadipate enol-lactonase
MARDAWELLQVLGIQKPWLLGLSNGSSISLELLAGHPGAFAGAVLTSSMPCIDFATRLRILHWLQCLDLGGPLMQFDAAAPYLWGDRFLEQRHGVLRAYHQVIASGQGHRALEPSQSVDPLRGDPLRGARLQMEGILQWDFRSRLGLVKDPLLLLCGAEDLLTPPWKCLETAQGIPHSRFEMVPSVGHALPVEEPKKYISYALSFIDETLREQQNHG